MYVRFGGEGFGNLLSQDGKALDSLAYYVSELLGKATIDTNTYGKSTGHSGNYSTNYQNTGRELMTPDEVRMLDNRYALLFIRGERPVLDEKYDIMKHPNVALSADGQGEPYRHGEVTQAVAGITLGDSLAGEITEEVPDGESYEILSDEELEAMLNQKHGSSAGKR